MDDKFSGLDFGHFALVTAWLLSVYGLVAGSIGARKKHDGLVGSAANSVVAFSALTILALLSLAAAFERHDYRYLYVWQTSNNDMPWYYLISAVWGGMDGSLLLWACLMTVFSAVVILKRGDAPRDLARWLAPVLSGACCFFLFVVVFLTNPFRFVSPGAIQPDGNGLNPLLQNPSMLIHPPLLYLGFTGFVVPFAFCLAALLSGNLGDHWIYLTRRWTLLAWGFLTCGIILGGNWAYIELGWGGFWAWDPVENASFLPWLTGTAFLHSVMVQERKGMLKIWNVCLSVLTYTLAVFGTFLTRSGVVQSVHAFAETDVGWVFLAYICVILVISAALLLKRYSGLRPDRKLESLFSREAAFLFNNLALLGICFATFWGVMFPVFSEALTGEKSVVGPPFFNRVNVPLFLALIFLMGVGPLISWRKASPRSMLKTFRAPFLSGCVVTAFFLWLDPSRLLPAISFGLCVFVVMTIESEIRRGLGVRREFKNENIARGVVGLVKRRPRKYGGFLVHFGICVMTVSITASSAYKIEKDVTLKVGERVEVGRYWLELGSLRQQAFSNYSALIADVKVFDKEGKEQLGLLSPERRFYKRNEETTTEVDIRVTPRDDLYLALAGTDAANASPDTPIAELPVILKVFVNPLQVWLWVGSMIVLCGTLVVLGPGLLVRQTAYSPSRAEASLQTKQS